MVLDDGAVLGVKIWSRKGTLKSFVDCCREPLGMVCGGEQLEELKSVPGNLRVVGLHGWLDSASTFNGIAPDLVHKSGVCFVGVDFIVCFPNFFWITIF